MSNGQGRNQLQQPDFELIIRDIERQYNITYTQEQIAASIEKQLSNYESNSKLAMRLLCTPAVINMNKLLFYSKDRGVLVNVYVHKEIKRLYIKFHNPISVSYEAHELDKFAISLVHQYFRLHYDQFRCLLCQLNSPDRNFVRNLSRDLQTLGLISCYNSPSDYLVNIMQAQDQYYDYENSVTDSSDSDMNDDDSDDISSGTNAQIVSHWIKKSQLFFNTSDKKPHKHDQLQLACVCNYLTENPEERHQIRIALWTNKLSRSAVEYFLVYSKLFSFNAYYNVIEYFMDNTSDIKDAIIKQAHAMSSESDYKGTVRHWVRFCEHHKIATSQRYEPVTGFATSQNHMQQYIRNISDSEESSYVYFSSSESAQAPPQQPFQKRHRQGARPGETDKRRQDIHNRIQSLKREKEIVASELFEKQDAARSAAYKELQLLNGQIAFAQKVYEAW